MTNDDLSLWASVAAVGVALMLVDWATVPPNVMAQLAGLALLFLAAVWAILLWGNRGRA